MLKLELQEELRLTHEHLISWPLHRLQVSLRDLINSSIGKTTFEMGCCLLTCNGLKWTSKVLLGHA